VAVKHRHANAKIYRKTVKDPSAESRIPQTAGVFCATSRLMTKPNKEAERKLGPARLTDAVQSNTSCTFHNQTSTKCQS
jgi:hypothetical protein